MKIRAYIKNGIPVLIIKATPKQSTKKSIVAIAKAN